MSNILDKNVSLYADAKSTEKIKDVNLYTYLTVPHPSYLPLIQIIRSELDKDRRAELKKQIPAITPSGTFSHRGDKGLIEHSGLICIDVDYKGNTHVENYTELKNQLKNINVVAYCGLSVSGAGYMLLIPIRYPEKHVEHFLALEKQFASIGLTVDTQCKNVERLRFYSFDPDAYFNLNADVYQKTYVREISKQEDSFKRVYFNDDTQSDVESCIEQINHEGIDITGGYDE